MRDQFDASLAAAFQDVPAPEGLMGRILDRLASDGAASFNGDSPIFADAKIGTVPSKRRVSRRWLLVGGGLLTAAAGLLLAVWLGIHKEESLNPQFVLDEAIRAFEEASDSSGYMLAEKPVPGDYPFSQFVANVRGTRWRQLEDFLGCRAVVYDLPGPAGTRASLYVVAQEADGIRTSPSLHPFTTAGCCASAWQEDGLLYVLVVQGDPSTYGGFLNLPRSPLA